MILALLLNYLNLFLEKFYGLLPQFNFQLGTTGAIAQFIYYIFSLDKFVPISNGLVPIVLIWAAIYTFDVGRTIVLAIFNGVRGSGVKV